MSKVTELEKVLTTLFRKGTEVGYTETEIDEFLENIDYRKIITYTLDSENGSSLRAAGWSCAGMAGGKCWTGSRKPASALCPAQMKLRYEKLL